MAEHLTRQHLERIRYRLLATEQRSGCGAGYGVPHLAFRLRTSHSRPLTRLCFWAMTKRPGASGRAPEHLENQSRDNLGMLE